MQLGNELFGFVQILCKSIFKTFQENKEAPNLFIYIV